MSELKVTSAKEYAEVVAAEAQNDKGELVRLPTRAVWRLRRAALDEMIIAGELPQSLVNETLEALRERGKPVGEPDPDAPPPEDSPERLIFIRETVRGNCLEPRLGYNEAGALCVLDARGKPAVKAKGGDILFAFRWITWQEGLPQDGLSKSGNRRERRAAVSRKGRRKVRPEPALAGDKG